MSAMSYVQDHKGDVGFTVLRDLTALSSQGPDPGRFWERSFKHAEWMWIWKQTIWYTLRLKFCQLSRVRLLPSEAMYIPLLCFHHPDQKPLPQLMLRQIASWDRLSLSAHHKVSNIILVKQPTAQLHENTINDANLRSGRHLNLSKLLVSYSPKGVVLSSQELDLPKCGSYTNMETMFNWICKVFHLETTKYTHIIHPAIYLVRAHVCNACMCVHETT